MKNDTSFNVNLETKLSDLNGIGSQLAKKLEKKELTTFSDLIDYFPRRYEDRSSLLGVHEALAASAKDPTFVTTVIVRCLDIKQFKFRNRRIKKFIFSDNKMEFTLPAFNPHLSFQIDEYYILSGKLKRGRYEIEMTLHEFEVFDSEAMESLNLGRIVPIYSRIDGLSQKRIRHYVRDILSHTSEEHLLYHFPQHLREKYQYPSKRDCYRKIHFPDSFKEVNTHLTPLIYEEFFNLQTIILKRKLEETHHKNIHYGEPSILIPLIESLPFQLTGDQRNAVKEIINDLKSERVMNRMLQGDVGTGKTLVALLTLVFCYDSGYQGAMMVPTEILAQQHFKTFKKILDPFDIKVRLLIGNQTQKEKELTLIDLEEEDRLIVIGTHSLIQKEVNFTNLKYIIIDEQHRFGVEQRNMLRAKGNKDGGYPDFLSMSATPIPRSLFITCFGDLDSSIIKEKPLSSSKQIIKSRLLLDFNRPHAYHFLTDRIKRGEQGYVVFPLIYESDSGRLKSLLESYEELKSTFLKDIPTSLIHGKVNAEEKNQIMHDFYQGKIKVLLATTILEVGIDHPNATTIIIESAYQYGLSQLHQLRGRVGRGEKPGYCYLISDSEQSPDSIQRLNQFCQLTDGFEIAELDLKLRGPGDIIGIKQSGIPPLKLGDLVKNFDLLKKARKDVEEFLHLK